MQNAGVAADRIPALVKICVFTIEELLAHSLPLEEKQNICAALVV